VNILIDTDIAIEILRDRTPEIRAHWFELSTSGHSVFYSPVVAAEVWAGALTIEHILISTFFHSLFCIPVGYEIGQLAGDFLRKYAKNHGLEIPNALIAASAVQQRAALWTRNRKHYPMPQLDFYN
jgi:predicted nucleic acid-binding protein